MGSPPVHVCTESEVVNDALCEQDCGVRAVLRLATCDSVRGDIAPVVKEYKCSFSDDGKPQNFLGEGPQRQMHMTMSGLRCGKDPECFDDTRTGAIRGAQHSACVYSI
jgi:hypothetical protein